MGSRQSLIRWQSIGSAGQSFIKNGPTQNDLSTFFSQTVNPPIRVYAGLRSRDTAIERANLVLEELIRLKGFSRKKMVIATPTGTG